MHFLFQKSLKLGKEVRSRFSLSENQVTIAKMLFQLSDRLLKELSEMPVLFIGNSEINRKVIAYFKRKGIHRIALCTRSPHSAQEMAERDNMILLPWGRLAEWQEYPLVICGSNAPHYLVDRPGLALSTRLIFDLSVPRNVDPALSRHPSLTLINMEELSGMIENRQTKNVIEINRAEAIILQGVQRYLHSFRQKEKRVYLCA
jgi:glutamyl-tRNA reductase